MDESEKLATIECSTCSALIEAYWRYKPEFSLVWKLKAGSANNCRHKPIELCPVATAEMERRFPETAPPEFDEQ